MILPLDDVVNVIINLSARSAVRTGFNLSLLIADSNVLTAGDRVAVYSSLDSMRESGFSSASPEYKAAQIFLAQSSNPGRVAIGYWDSANESLAEAIAACRVANREWYGVVPLGKIGFPSAATYTLSVNNLSLAMGGNPVLLTPNTSYRMQFGSSAAASVTITTGAAAPVTDEGFAAMFNGTNFTLNGKTYTGAASGKTLIYTAGSTGEATPIGLTATLYAIDSEDDEHEIDLEGYTAVFLDGSSVDGAFANPSMSDVLGAAAVVEACTPSTVMFAAVDNSTMATLKGLSYRRTLGVVSENVDIPVAILGWAMGANTRLINSAFTIKFKQLVGVPVDQLAEAKVSDAKAVNGNVYINRGATYNWFEDGTMADGTWFDEMINLDMLANYVQLSVCDLLNQRPKVPQTEAGVLQIINAFTPDLELAVRTGFVAPGIWNIPGFLTLEQGDAIEKGYLVLSEAINDQSPADRDARLAPPIYIALKLAGAIHYVVSKSTSTAKRKENEICTHQITRLTRSKIWRSCFRTRPKARSRSRARALFP
jgi:hypothetical protein